MYKYNASHIKSAININEQLFNAENTKEVEYLPKDVDGNIKFLIKCEPAEWVERQRDARHFIMHSSRKKSLPGTRKTGKCMGGLVCSNENCPRVKSGLEPNMVAFENVASVKRCKICGQFAKRRFCGAQKATEYNNETGQLTVWHQGIHRCCLKPNVYNQEEKNEKFNLIKEFLEKNPKVSNAKIGDMAFQFYMSRNMPKEAKTVIKACTDRRLVNSVRRAEMEKIVYSGLSNFEALARLQETSKAIDPYHIFKFNNKAWNGELSYVMKSSKMAAKIALQMHATSQENPLKEELVYMDAMHSRLKEYKSLTLWVYNPTSLKLMRLATMDAEGEDEANVENFLRKFNHILSLESGDPKFIWKPCGFMTDEAGANKLAISKVFGKDVAEKSVSCQWHFLRCARKRLGKVRTEDKNTFLHTAKELVNGAVSKSEYMRLNTIMEEICKRNDMKPWFEFWSKRKYHIVPAYRGYQLSGLNLAEAGQSGMKQQISGTFINLVDAAFKDIAAFMRQDEAYGDYCDNISSSGAIGRGLNQQQVLARQYRQQMKRASIYSQSLVTGDMYLEVSDSDEEAASFRPAAKDSHEAPNQKRKRKSRKQQGNADKQARVEPENNTDCVLVPEEVEEEFLKTTVPCVTFINKFIKKCYGCKHLFQHQYMQAPKNMLFRMKTQRMVPNKDGGPWRRSHTYSNAYYCLRDLACLARENSGVALKDIYMGNFFIKQLTAEHKEVLQKLGYWEHILKNRQQLCEQI